jgi:hypothetical protein
MFQKILKELNEEEVINARNNRAHEDKNFALLKKL